eukprot:6213873-Pleurochrysis_carterae.AAC.2
MQEMPLPKKQVLKRLHDAGDSLSFGKQRVPLGSDSNSGFACVCVLIGADTCIQFSKASAIGWATKSSLRLPRTDG